MLSLIGVVLAVITGWLGGELVTRLGIGVDTGAHADSPSSLSDKPATLNAGEESVIRGSSTIAQAPQAFRPSGVSPGRTAGLETREHVELNREPKPAPDTSAAARRHGGTSEMDI